MSQPNTSTYDIMKDAEMIGAATKTAEFLAEHDEVADLVMVIAALIHKITNPEKEEDRLSRSPWAQSQFARLKSQLARA